MTSDFAIGFASDPYLCGALAAESVRGTQEAGVITSIKVACHVPLSSEYEN